MELKFSQATTQDLEKVVLLLLKIIAAVSTLSACPENSAVF
jgi:hypothetical protein